jgi:hypothetical protein
MLTIIFHASSLFAIQAKTLSPLYKVMLHEIKKSIVQFSNNKSPEFIDSRYSSKKLTVQIVKN